jgi:hypothetical protein
VARVAQRDKVVLVIPPFIVVKTSGWDYVVNVQLATLFFEVSFLGQPTRLAFVTIALSNRTLFLDPEPLAVGIITALPKRRVLPA